MEETLETVVDTVLQDSVDTVLQDSVDLALETTPKTGKAGIVVAVTSSIALAVAGIVIGVKKLVAKRRTKKETVVETETVNDQEVTNAE